MLIKLRKGFTLIEMTIVLFIISLLILIIIPNLGSQKKHARSVHGSAMTSMVQTQIDSYSDELGDGNVNFPKLVEHHYLTEKQVQQAQAENIAIEGNHAYQK
ncbi:competence type IV pilus major pilin ComGC [Fructilactobacillus cliffordii]|uniref:Prepilin-type N-terminal cleavage/methylation domain-containing protein n=1 Tax=Fructilactobacillus cliffordii TaxID=2940299 RepID=A0A9Q9E3Q9_9LACO|nr:competence type IV pilus major pilin ComGC [Fructilactobacillus cliffordii]USS86787.1 prepilin-type N-terminal cleavage/methylation domain-containing protein [Fructilactobacillus cliffordii]USS89783.1 prepilin-type N-terminal cleavage/methylation domain-containing protein [Fructilactobacillus cliffordii]